jgi:hypothetical protein
VDAANDLYPVTANEERIGGIFQKKVFTMKINFNISENVAVAVIQGEVFYEGNNNSRSGQYMGFALTYNFLKPHSVNKQRKKKTLVSDN